MFCKNCGSEVKDNQKFCPKCGTLIESTEVHRRINGQRIRKYLSAVLITILIVGLFSYIGVSIYKNGKYCSEQTLRLNFDGSLASETTTAYRQDGQKLSSINIDYTNDMDEKSTENYEYDSLGRMVKIYGSGPEDGEISIEFIYSEKDNQYVGIGNASDKSGTIELVYGKDIKLISRTVFDESGQMCSKELYDNEGHTIEMTYFSDGKETLKNVYEYDSKAALNKYSCYNDGKISNTTEYNYDIRNSEIDSIMKTIEYDETGKVISEKTESMITAKESDNIFKTICYDENNETDGSYSLTAYENKISKRILKFESVTSTGSNSVTEYKYQWKDFTKLDTWKEVLF